MSTKEKIATSTPSRGIHLVFGSTAKEVQGDPPRLPILEQTFKQTHIKAVKEDNWKERDFFINQRRRNYTLESTLDEEQTELHKLAQKIKNN